MTVIGECINAFVSVRMEELVLDGMAVWQTSFTTCEILVKIIMFMSMTVRRVAMAVR